MIDNKTIENVKNKLIELYKPLEIYLFGSYAWGYPDEESDLDLLIVIDDYKDTRHKMLVEGHLALSNFRLSKDLLLYNKQEFYENSEDITTLCHKVKHQGKKIYGKA